MLRCTAFALVALGTTALMGCGGASGPAAQESAGHEHAHPSEGPHGGDLIELGNEEYHAEVVHDDDAGNVTIYLLDATASQSVPIEATEVKVNMKHDDKAEQFSLAAAPDQADPAGKSSRFVSEDAELVEELDHDHVDAQLVVTISGKQYRGKVEHDHGDHAHDHGDDSHDHAGDSHKDDGHSHP